MPVLTRQMGASQIQTPTLTDVQMPGGTAPVMQQSADLSLGYRSSFWTGLAAGAIKVASAAIDKNDADSYLQGQADAAAGKEMEAKNVLGELAYAQGYNKITLESKLSEFQFKAQKKAAEYAASGKDVATFQKDFSEDIRKVIDDAKAQGLNLRSEDHQAWIQGVSNTRMLASNVFLKQEEAHRQQLNIQSISKAANASLTEINAANGISPQDKYKSVATSVQNFVGRVENDPTLDLPTQEAVKASYFNSVFQNFKSKEDVNWGLQTITQLDSFKNLSIDNQQRLIQNAQLAYERNAQSEVGEVLGTNFQINHISSLQELDAKYPRNAVYAAYRDAYTKKIITAPQMFNFMDNYERQYALLGKTAKLNAVYANGSALEISAKTGDTVDTVKSKLAARYSQDIGYARGGGAMILDGLRMQDRERIDQGASMLTDSVQGLTLIDPKTVQRDKDGNPIVPEDMAVAVSVLSEVWNNFDSKPTQRDFIFRNLPEAVKWGLQQKVDSRQLVSVIVGRQQQLNTHVKEKAVERIPDNLRFNIDELDRGITDWGWSQKAKTRIAFGNFNLYTSTDDEALLRNIANPLNDELQLAYHKAVQTGRTASTIQDTVNNIKMDMVSRAVRIQDGSDAGTMLLLPDVDDATKKELMGTVSNDVLERAMTPMLREVHQKYPQATFFAMDYDDIDGAFRVRTYDTQGVELTGAVPSIRPEQIRAAVDEWNQGITQVSKADSERVPLFVPGVGVISGYDTKNDYNVAPEQMQDMVQWIVHHEGYSSTKGFSILPQWHGYEYAKLPNENAVQAAGKLSRFVNDKILPEVMPAMQQYKGLPNTLKNNLMVTLAETTYHSGNVNAFNQYVQRVMRGESADNVVKDFLSQAPHEPYIQQGNDKAGNIAERNAYRIRLLEDLGTYVQSQK